LDGWQGANYIQGYMSSERNYCFCSETITQSSFSDLIDDTKWLLKLGYLGNIFQPFNTLNKRVPDPKENNLNSTGISFAFFPNEYSRQ
jgi:hypothetical protein